jgi:hypothetical protein
MANVAVLFADGQQRGPNQTTDEQINCRKIEAEWLKNDCRGRPAARVTDGA